MKCVGYVVKTFYKVLKHRLLEVMAYSNYNI